MIDLKQILIFFICIFSCISLSAAVINTEELVTVNAIDTQLSLLPQSSRITTGDTIEITVQLNTAPQGLSGYNVTIQLTDPTVGEIIGIRFPSWASLPTNSTVPADVVWCKAADLSGNSGIANITLIVVKLHAEIVGKTNIIVIPTRVEDRQAGRYSPSVIQAELVVENTVEQPVADFSTNVTFGTTPLTVQFTDTSTGDPTSWSWNFGDGNTSTKQHPLYTYVTPGNYTVNLTVSNGENSDRISKQNYIMVTKVKGDFNGNGYVDIGDASKVAYMVAGKVPEDLEADFNGNGYVDTGDAARIAWYFVGKTNIL